MTSDRDGLADALAVKAARWLADPPFLDARHALQNGDLANASRLLDHMLVDDPTHAIARCLRAEIELRHEQFGCAEFHFRQSIAAAPGYLEALHGLAFSLFSQHRLGEAAGFADRMLSLDPVNLPARLLKAAIAAHAGDHDTAALLYRGIVAQHPNHVPSWLGLGHSRRAIGASGDAIAAYRQALAHDPAGGEAWACLAALKTYAFDDREIAAMAAAEQQEQRSAADRIYLQFALGKAFFDRGDDRRAFRHYAQGNALARARRSRVPLAETGALERWVEDTIANLPLRRTADGNGETASEEAPIFIVGMPRSGTTLVEQILGSHSTVEGVGELPYIDLIAKRLIDARAHLPDIDPAALAREYLDAARIHRRTGKPRFVDKLPANYPHLALIRAMFPRAPIIDVRRHPLASCVSIFRQHFIGMPELAGTPADIAKIYLGYAGTMRRFDEIMSGSVHRLFYEHLVEDTDAEIRRLLDRIGLPFEAACLRWYENGAPVRTPSSEQVRQPIFRSGLDQWRRFAGELNEAETILAKEVAGYPTRTALVG